MADQDKAMNAADSGENTQTRKTVKLKMPTAPVTAQMTPPPAANAPIADPLNGRDTDTGNLDVLSDTQTRKTVKLKPIAPLAEKRPVNIPGIATPPAPSPTAETAAGATHTRKVVMLKPTALKNTPVNPAPTAAPGKQTMVLPNTPKPAAAAPGKQTMVLPGTQPAAPAADEDVDTVQVARVGAPVKPNIAIESPDDNTIKMHAVGAAVPAAAEGPEDNTVRMPAMPHPAEASEDNTVKLARPGKTAPAPAVPRAANVQAPDEDKATVKLARPAMPTPAAPAPAPTAAAPAPAPAPVAPAPAPVAPAAATPAPVAEPPAEAPAAEKPKKLSLAKKGDDTTAAPPRVAAEMEKLGLTDGAIKDSTLAPAAQSNSTLYTALAAITLLLLIASATLTTVQYLKFDQGIQIDLPIGK